VRAGAPAGDDAPLSEDLRILREVRRVSPASQVVVLAAHALPLALCCQAVRYGAAGFVEWSDGDPVDRLVERLAQALNRYEAAVEEGRLLHTRAIFEETGVTSQSRVMARLLFQAKRSAMISDAPILIFGESGTGNQLLAEAIHRMDPKRRKEPFLTVNCAAITGSLAESALFGHRKGAFTGATEDRPGYFRAANGGTLLLDEISELERPLQPKLLRVLQEGRVMPVGDEREYPIDVRIIAACNRPLPALVEEGEFRLDLYQRLNVINLHVPPLRDRRDDIPLLVQFFLKRYSSYCQQPIEAVDERVHDVLAASIGSGNIRELENAVRQILAFKTAGNRIELSDIPPHLLDGPRRRESVPDITEALATQAVTMFRTGRLTLPEMLDDIERLVLREALSNGQVNHSELARQLGLSRRTFYNKLKKHDLTGQE
jgi:DNA-binding NtrC family response regulator